jgi:nitrogen fixation/metabolism regulation signal transduction histidine kinase
MRRIDAMQLTSRRIVFYILMFLMALLVLFAPIWLGLGPVVHSHAAVTARISN